MNFFDSYGVAGPSNATDNQQQNTNQPSLDDEVQEVIGSFRSFWGGFKKQSQTVFQSAKKELTDVAGQAQRELNRLTTEPVAGDAATARSAADSESTPETSSESKDLDPITGSGSQGTETPRAVPKTEADDDSDTPPASPSASSSPTPAPDTSSNAGSFFSSFQSAIPQNWLETAREQLPESLRNVDSTQLRTTLISEFQRVQDVTLAHAEEYAHKGEALFQQAVENASHVLKDAVKVIPPEEQDSSGSRMPPVLSWDGGDMWALPIGPLDASASRSSTDSPASKEKGKAAAEGQSAVASRAEQLQLRLKQDPDIIRRDPADDGELGKNYAKWIEEDFDGKGGVDGEEYGGKIKSLSEDESMKKTKEALVPSEMTEDEFWRRYFFRAHQIQVESEKRKAIIDGTLEEEEIAWEDDDEEGEEEEEEEEEEGEEGEDGDEEEEEEEEEEEDEDDDEEDEEEEEEEEDNSTQKPAKPEVVGKKPSNSTLKASAVVRDSSDDGFDVVSAGTISPAPKRQPQSNDESDDSDWE